LERRLIAEQLFDLVFLLKKGLIRYTANQAKMEYSPMQMHVLHTMLDKDVCTMTELAGDVLISKQQLTPIIDKLVCSGLVLRETDAADRRVVKICLSPAGREFLVRKIKEAIGIFETRIACLDAGDLKRLDDALPSLREILRKLP
jgi:DNA-binding MarR family transcriptional regulator